MFKKKNKVIGSEKILKKKLAGIILIILAFLLAFVAIPAINKISNKTADIVICKVDLKKGDIIRENDISIQKRGVYNLKDYFLEKDKVVGQMVAKDMEANDVVLKNKIGKKNLKKIDLIIKEGHTLMSITMKNNAAAVSSHLKKGDIVRVYYIKENDEGENNIIENPLLNNIEVYSIETASAKEAVRDDYEKNKEAEEIIASTITLIAINKEQEKALLDAEYSGNVHIAFIKR